MGDLRVVFYYSHRRLGVLGVGTLVWAITRSVLMIPKIVALTAQYPYVALAVAGALFVNALVMWLLAADLVVRQRLAGVTIS